MVTPRIRTKRVGPNTCIAAAKRLRYFTLYLKIRKTELFLKRLMNAGQKRMLAPRVF
jgi:hypothetical protein